MSFTCSGSLEDASAHGKRDQMLQVNLGLLASANPCLGTLTGLLILSLCPANGFEARFARAFDHHGALSRASAIGHALGLQDAVDRARLETESDLVGAACFRPLVGDLAMVSCALDSTVANFQFYTVAHRTAW